MIEMNKWMKFKVRDPFDKIIKQNRPYRVVDIRLTSSLIKNQKNVYELLYRKLNRTKTEYESDVRDDVLIVTLEDKLGREFEIPKNMIEEDTGAHVGVAEHVLKINLGGIGLKTDLNGLDGELIEYVKSRTGIEPDVKLLITSAEEYVEENTFLEFEKSRVNNRTAKNIFELYRSVAKENKRLKAHLAAVVQHEKKKRNLDT